MAVVWRKNQPTSLTRLKDLPAIHSDNFNIVSSAADLEHYSMLSATGAISGYHKPGIVGGVFEGATSAINALVGTAKDGALAYDTNLGVFKYYTISNSAWNIISSAKWSRVRAYLSGTPIPVTAGASAEIIPFDAEDFDGLSEYDQAGTFTALTSGYYLILANVAFIASGNQAVSARYYPAASAVSEDWAPSGVANNWNNVEEVTANDADNNATATALAIDLMSASTPITALAGATDIEVKVNWRAKRAGCVCDHQCYSETCACHTSCFDHHCTVCNQLCYGYSTCTCNGWCYGYVCSCDVVCYADITW